MEGDGSEPRGLRGDFLITAYSHRRLVMFSRARIFSAKHRSPFFSLARGCQREFDTNSSAYIAKNDKVAGETKRCYH